MHVELWTGPSPAETGPTGTVQHATLFMLIALFSEQCN